MYTVAYEAAINDLIVVRILHVKQKQARALLQACMGDLTTRGFNKLINRRVEVKQKSADFCRNVLFLEEKWQS